MPIPAPPRFGSAIAFWKVILITDAISERIVLSLKESDNGGYRVDIPLLISQHPRTLADIYLSVARSRRITPETLRGKQSQDCLDTQIRLPGTYTLCLQITFR